MRKMAVAAVIWVGLLAGLLAVAVANRPDHNTVFIAGPGSSGLDKLISGHEEKVSVSLLDAWSSTYTLVLVLGAIVILAISLVLNLYQGRPVR